MMMKMISLAFLYDSAMFCGFLNIFLVHVGLCMINKHSMHSFVTIGDQLDELCSFSGSLPHVYLH